jgi:glutathione synthase/RimK-type ligase-like ATP-grasp enzyme
VARLTVAVLVEGRYRAQRQPRGLIDALRRRGHVARVIDPRETVQRAGDDAWLRNVDLVVARGRSWELLTLLSSAEEAGVPVMNRRQAISSVHNKADMAVHMARANIPMPRTWIGTPQFLASSIPADAFPLVVKPIFGDNSRGVRVFCSPDDLRAVQHSDAMLGQQFLPNDGFDVKLYAIGGEVWAVRKPSPLAPNASVETELMTVTGEARDLALRCGELFGLQLFGVDCVESGPGLSVIEVNDYPNYSSVPDAGGRIADLIERSLEESWCAAS